MTRAPLPGKLPEWPEPEDFCTPAVDKWYEAVKYHVAMTAYWESRARLAVKTLEWIMRPDPKSMNDPWAMAEQALKDIGVLPEEERT